MTSHIPSKMATSNFTTQLAHLEASSNPQQRLDGYTQTLDNIISSGDSELSANLIAYAQSILSDSIGVIHSRPLLSTFVERYRNISATSVKIDAGAEIVQLLAPKIVSYEQQDTDLKFVLADAYEVEEDFTNSAKTLQTIVLDSSQGRNVTDDEKAAIWMRICRCYLVSRCYPS